MTLDVLHWGLGLDDAPVLSCPAAHNGLGLDAWQTWAFWRADLSPFVESPFRCPNGKRASMVVAQTLPVRCVGAERLLALLQRPFAVLERALQGLPADARIALSLGLGDRFGDGALPVFAAQRAQLEAALQAWLSARWPRASLALFANGNASFACSCLHAGKALNRGDLDLALVGAVDSMWDPPVIDEMIESGRLFDLEELDSCTPGEGAALLVLSSPRSARRLGLTPVARLESAARSIEPASMLSDLPCAGDGLAQAMRAVTGRLKVDRRLVPWILGDVTNERYRAHEWGLALPRSLAGGGLDTGGSDYHALFDDDLTIDFLPECFGDLGGATMATAAVIATEAFARGAPKAEGCLLVGSAVGTTRGALLLSSLQSASGARREP